MKREEYPGPDDFEASLRGLRPAAAAVDVSKMFYRAGLEAGVLQPQRSGKVAFIKLPAVVVLTALMVGSLSYRAGRDSAGTASVSTPNTTKIAAKPKDEDSGEAEDLDAPLVATELDHPTLQKHPLLQARQLLHAAVPHRRGASLTSNLYSPADLYRTPRRSVPRFRNQVTLSAGSSDAIDALLGELR